MPNRMPRSLSWCVLAFTVAAVATSARADAQDSDCRRRPFQPTVAEEFTAGPQHT